jgi:hypothetical protein
VRRFERLFASERRCDEDEMLGRDQRGACDEGDGEEEDKEFGDEAFHCLVDW